MLLRDHKSTAIIYGDKQYSYADVLRYCGVFASILKKHSAKRTAIFAENRPEWVFTIYSALHVKVVPVLFDYNAEVEEITDILNDTQPEVIFYSADYAEKLTGICKSLQYTPQIISLDEAVTCSENTVIEYIEPAEENMGLIVYTSGTTGSPKGVMLTVSNVVNNFKPFLVFANENECELALLPWYHCFPLQLAMFAPLYLGATIVIARSLNPTELMNLLQKYKITVLTGVPRLFEKLREAIMKKINESFATRAIFKAAELLNSMAVSRLLFNTVHQKFGGNIHYFICGGAAISPEIEKDFKTLGFKFVTGYGLTETSPIITFNFPTKIRIGSAGVTIPGCEARIVDGEVVARGKNIMAGYFNNKEATDAIIVDGWLHTGDLGYFDKDGFLFITGRKKEIIVLSNGKNINPAEIENKLEAQFPVIQEVAVTDVDDSLHALIYLNKENLDGITEDIHEYIKWKVVDVYNKTAVQYKRIMGFTIISTELPKTPIGKTKRFKLHELIDGKKPIVAEPQQPMTPEYESVANHIRDSKNIEVTPGQNLVMDIGLDSLDKVVLLAYIEKNFGIRITEQELSQFKTLGELSDYIKAEKEKFEHEKAGWKDLVTDADKVRTPFTWVGTIVSYAVFKILGWIWTPIKAVGTENIPQDNFIIASNHRTYIDPLYIASALTFSQARKTHYYAKAKYFPGVVKLVAEVHNVILVDIDNDLKTSMMKIAAALKKKKNLIIFPEGTRSITGELADFKKFYAILSCELNTPIVPVVLSGSADALPRGAFWLRFGKQVTVQFLPPVYPGHHTYDSLNKEVYKKISDNLFAVE
jgi:long-chain acyl-CoA synthetase